MGKEIMAVVDEPDNIALMKIIMFNMKLYNMKNIAKTREIAIMSEVET